MKSIRIEVICIGSELLHHKVNTHTVTLGEKLSQIGLSIRRAQTIGDVKKEMEETFREVLKRSDVIISVGGLGPTFDDISRDVWQKVTRRPLQFQATLLEGIQNKFSARGLVMPKQNKRQAFLLKGAKPIPNLFGTAPGQYLILGKKILVLLPGPGREMIPMVDQFLIPYLRKRFPTRYFAQKKFHLVGIPESVVAEQIQPIISKYKKITHCSIVYGILASQAVITVKFRVEGPKKDLVNKVAKSLALRFRKNLKSMVFGEDEDQLESVVGNLLKAKSKTLALAESCTGGLISKFLTDVPGSSQFLKEAIVSYSNESKIQRLGVNPKTIETHGAVSESVAKEMAAGLRQRNKVDFGLSVTGVAGPEGGTSKKPVGLVYVGCSSPNGTVVKEFRFKGERDWIRHRAALMALDLLRREILKI